MTPLPHPDPSHPDPSHPDPPQAPYFDPVRGAWVLSRYADVVAAMQHPHLWPVGGNREIEVESRDDAGRLKLRTEALARFSQLHLAPWRPRIEAEAHRILESLPVGRPVDLLREFTLPWGLTLAILTTGTDPAHRNRSATSARVSSLPPARPTIRPCARMPQPRSGNWSAFS